MLVHGSWPAIVLHGKHSCFLTLLCNPPLVTPVPVPVAAAMMRTQHLGMHSVAGVVASGGCWALEKLSTPNHLHIFARNRVWDIRCLHKGWGLTSNCPHA